MFSNKKHNKTMKTKKKSISKKMINNSKIDKTFQQECVIMFVEMLNTVKLFHWKTNSFSIHKATDELYGSLNGSIDSFVETMLGKNGERVNLTHIKTIELNDFNSQDSFKNEIVKYKEFMKSVNNYVDPVNDSDLLNIRDEILGHLNKFSYLLTFHL